MPKGKPYKTGMKYRVNLSKAVDPRNRKDEQRRGKASGKKRVSDSRIGY